MGDLGPARRTRALSAVFGSVLLVVVVGAGWACGSSSGEHAGPGTADASPDATTSDAPSDGAIDGGDLGDALADGASGDYGPAQIVAKDLHALWEIACDEQAAFVTVEGAASLSTVLRIADGAAPAPLASSQYKGRYPVVDDARVYWLAGETSGGYSYLRATSKDDGGAPTSYFPDGFGSNLYSSLAREGTTLAFYASTGGGRIFRGLTDGGGADVATSQGSVPGLALDGAYVYWLSTTGDVLRSAKTDGTAPETFLAGAGATAIAVADSEAFFTSDDGQLRALSTATPGGLPRVVAGGLDLARKLALDTKRAFWVNTSTGSIATVPLMGGTPVVIGSGAAGSSIAVCANAIWFTDPAKGDVLRVARNGG